MLQECFGAIGARGYRATEKSLHTRSRSHLCPTTGVDAFASRILVWTPDLTPRGLPRGSINQAIDLQGKPPPRPMSGWLMLLTNSAPTCP